MTAGHDDASARDSTIASRGEDGRRFCVGVGVRREPVSSSSESESESESSSESESTRGQRMLVTTTSSTTTTTTMKRGRWNSSYVEGVGVWDDRSAKRRECDPSTTTTTSSTTTTTGFARDASTPSFSTTTTSVDADMTDVSSPTRRHSCLTASDETGIKRRGGVARALAFGDVSREAFPLDPSAMC